MAIKVFRSDQLGAPALNGVAGTLISTLDAVLVNGYGSVGVSSITRVGSTVTVTTATAHGLLTGDSAAIGGAVQTDYNGEFVITQTGGTTFTYTVLTTPVTPATGSITSKRAGAGFTKSFAATNKGVYRSNDVSSRQYYYRFIDDGTTAGGAREARLTGYITMSDVDTGTDLHPTAAQFPTGYYCVKSGGADSVSKHWACVTDGKTVYFFTYIDSFVTADFAAGGSNMGAFAFGDVLAYRAGDVYASFCTGAPSANVFTSTQYSGVFVQQTTITNYAPGTSSPVISFSRDYTGITGARNASLFASALSGSLGSVAYMSYPHLIDNGFYMVPVLISQSGGLLRGRMPGIFEPMHGPVFPNGTTIDNVQGYTGRKFTMFWGKGGSAVGALMIDVTGPWDS